MGPFVDLLRSWTAVEFFLDLAYHCSWSKRRALHCMAKVSMNPRRVLVTRGAVAHARIHAPGHIKHKIFRDDQQTVIPRGLAKFARGPQS